MNKPVINIALLKITVGATDEESSDKQKYCTSNHEEKIKLCAVKFE